LIDDGKIEFELEFCADTEVFGEVVNDVLLTLISLTKKFLLLVTVSFSNE
jgi:hypothetical protein